MNFKFNSNFSLKIVIVIVFFFSGLGKLINSSSAEKVVELFLTSSFEISSYLIRLIIVLLAIIEIICSLSLFYPKYSTYVYNCLNVIIVGFILFLISLPLRGIYIEECGCFGMLIPSGSIPIAIVKNLILLFIINYAFYEGKKTTKD